MLSLAVYEALTPAEVRGQMEKFIEEWNGKAVGSLRHSEGDPLGNAMVDSARQLSGVQQETKKLKKPRKPKNLTRGKGRNSKSRGRGRGRKVIRGRKAKTELQRAEEVKTPARRKERKNVKAPQKR